MNRHCARGRGCGADGERRRSPPSINHKTAILVKGKAVM